MHAVTFATITSFLLTPSVYYFLNDSQSYFQESNNLLLIVALVLTFVFGMFLTYAKKYFQILDTLYSKHRLFSYFPFVASLLIALSVLLFEVNTQQFVSARNPIYATLLTQQILFLLLTPQSIFHRQMVLKSFSKNIWQGTLIITLAMASIMWYGKIMTFFVSLRNF